MNQSGNKTNGPSRPRPRGVWVVRVVVGLAVALGLGLLLALIVAMFGTVIGEEFSPDKLARRTFYYREIPLLRIQVTPTRRENIPWEIATYLKNNNFVPASTEEEPRWDQVWARRTGSAHFSGDAAILCSYLEIRQDNEWRWIAWSKAHPKLAAALWPAVVEVARDGLYVFVPDLIDLTSNADDPDQFRQDLAETLSRKYERLADVHEEQGEHDLAEKYRGRAEEVKSGK